ncbi:MAG: LD-carboxypeptidase [Bacteroidales bacterium]|nr:LD-carboxypeptidase [Bacteroidales bacterium]
MFTPAYLKKGDKIAIISTARKIKAEDIKAAVEVIEGWGLKVVLGKNLFCDFNQFAGTDQQRADDLQFCLDDESIKAILTARGGYGTVRIIDRIDYSRFKQNPKWICGYSDTTVLHSHIHKLGFETLHCEMPFRFADVDKDSLNSLKKCLFGEVLTYNLGFNILNRQGKAKGILVGGNLSILYSLAGSISDLNTEGKILFIEDLDEYLYHIDRMMQALKRSGKLSGLAGLIVGGMTEMKDNIVPFGKSAEEIIINTVKEYNYPVCFGFNAGHTFNNLALILGRQIELNVYSDMCSLIFMKQKK